MANEIVIKKRVPVELAHYLGIRVQSNSALSMGLSRSCYGSDFNSTNLSAPGSPFSNFTSSNSASQSPIHYSISGKTSPNLLASSPMHQITKGISGLSTGGGSITRGTSAASESAANQPLDLSMDTTPSSGGTTSDNSPNNPSNASLWYVPAQFYDLKPLNLSPAQPVRIATTPPASPNLCIIQEEQQAQMPHYQITEAGTSTTMSIDDGSVMHSPPQISVTDVQGSEVTLVAASGSEDSLDAKTSMTLQGLIISEPSSDMPSITRGVGRKSSLEIEHRHDAYERRGSDKSLGFSDDSLSNDSNLVSPCHDPSAASSGFKSGDSEITEAPLSPDSLSDSRRMSEECYELPLPHECSDLDSSRIIEIVKQTIDSKMPPKCFVVHKMEPSQQAGETFGHDSEVPFSLDISNVSLEYSGGLQIELQVYGGKCKDQCNKGIKLRRISGDQFEYGKLCQQLISSLTV